ncbi:MAG: hypothetical protein ACOH13_05060 [Flavobacteriales bacterium]
MKQVLIGMVAISMVACAPKVRTTLAKTYPTLDFKQKVSVIGISEEVPQDAIVIGSVKVGDSGFSTNCGWDVVIEKAKMEARKVGGNALKITEHKPPGLSSSCDQITATILKVQDVETTLNALKVNEDPIVDSTWNYAKLYVYRPRGIGPLVGYDLYMGDSVICRVKNKSKYEINITKRGYNSLWAKTEAKSEVPIDIIYGREYYLRCTVVVGVMVGHPKLQLVDRTQGKADYDSIKAK